MSAELPYLWTKPRHSPMRRRSSLVWSLYSRRTRRTWSSYSCSSPECCRCAWYLLRRSIVAFSASANVAAPGDPVAWSTRSRSCGRTITFGSSGSSRRRPSCCSCAASSCTSSRCAWSTRPDEVVEGFGRGGLHHRPVESWNAFLLRPLRAGLVVLRRRLARTFFGKK
jgi:hypothetical protein